MKYITFFTFFGLLVSCSSDIDPELLAQIENRTEQTEDLFDHYEELNDELMEVIEEQAYAYKKLIKTRNALREVNNRIISRKKRIKSVKGEDLKPKDGENPKPKPRVNPNVVQGHQERLAVYNEEQAELQAEADEWLAETRKFTEQALKLRTARNKAYDEYTKSRLALKELNKKAGREN